MNLTQWVANYNSGKFDIPDVDMQIEVGWWDWFCQDFYLVERTKSLAPWIKALAASPKINPDNVEVALKNNCPLDGLLYDVIQIKDKESGKILYTITPWRGFTKLQGESNVWGRENDYKKALVEGSLFDIANFFGIHLTEEMKRVSDSQRALGEAETEDELGLLGR